MRSVDTLKNACASVDGTSSSGGPTGTAAGRDIAAATILRAAELLEKLTLTSTTSNTAPVVAAATSPTLPAPQWRLDDSLDQECQV